MIASYWFALMLLTPCSSEASGVQFESAHSQGQPSNSRQIDQTAVVATRAIFVNAEVGMTANFGLRFEARTLSGDGDFELVRRSIVTRNGQPARLFDLRTGDQIMIYQADPNSPYVVRVDAVSN